MGRFSRRKTYPWILAGLVLLILLGMDFSVRNLYLFFRKAPHGRIYNPVFNHGLRENYSWTDKYGPIRTPYFSNSLGFRDGTIREVPLRSGKPRILLIGDSYCEAVGVPWGQTFAGILEEKLAPRGVEILNAGVMSYTPLLMKTKLRYLLDQRGLVVGRVVLFLDLSDVKDELFYEEDAKGNARLIPYGPFASKAGWGTQVELFGEFSENVLEPNFVLLGALSRNLKLHLRQAFRKELGKQGAFTTLPDWIQYLETDEEEKKQIARQGVEKLKRTLGELHLDLRSRGAPLTLVIFPRQEYAMKGTQPTKFQSQWRVWCRQEGVDFIDLFPFFPEGKDSSDLYIPGDGHWSVAGHTKVAKILLESWDKIRPPDVL